MKNFFSSALFVLLILLIGTDFLKVESQTCKPSGAIKGIKPPPGQCNTENDSDCCKQGKLYKTYKCSPPVSSNTKAYLTINSFEKGGDGGGPSECDNQYHSDDTPVIALSTGWFAGKSRCLNNIVIHGNGRSVVAKVVDECDSLWDVIVITITSHRVLTTLWMLPKLFRKHWASLKVTGVDWTLPGLMLRIYCIWNMDILAIAVDGVCFTF